MNHTQASVLGDIASIRGRASALLATTPTLHAAQVVVEMLDALAAQVAAQWPLPEAQRAQVVVGRYAVRNLDDIDEALAGACASLEAAVRKDGPT